MQSILSASDLALPCEEVINGFTIYIEANPDRWRGGYSWSVCKDGVELDTGLELSISDAFARCYSFI